MNLSDTSIRKGSSGKTPVYCHICRISVVTFEGCWRLRESGRPGTQLDRYRRSPNFYKNSCHVSLNYNFSSSAICGRFFHAISPPFFSCPVIVPAFALSSRMTVARLRLLLTMNKRADCFIRFRAGKFWAADSMRRDRKDSLLFSCTRAR
jgi:hypothetical protein